MKYLDRITSGNDESQPEAIILQQSEEQYSSWKQVEKHLIKDGPGRESTHIEQREVYAASENTPLRAQDPASEKRPDSAGGALSQQLLSKLNFAKDPETASTASTPPASPLSSGPQSSKTSPEVKQANLSDDQSSNVPPMLKPLLNSIVWYTFEKPVQDKGFVATFVTNNADIAELARSFGVAPKNVVQLRKALGVEEQENKMYERKGSTPPSIATIGTNPEPRGLFKYEEDSDDEEVVFKPRGRGAARGGSARGSPSLSIRGMNGPHRSPIPAYSRPVAKPRPEVPTQEIDPDSFDRGSFGRGSFGRGSTPLADTAPHFHTPFQGHRGVTSRGSFTPTGPARGAFVSGGPSRGGFTGGGPPRGNHFRGSPRGFDRGSMRGNHRGRTLFVP